MGRGRGALIPLASRPRFLLPERMGRATAHKEPERAGPTDEIDGAPSGARWGRDRDAATPFHLERAESEIKIWPPIKQVRDEMGDRDPAPHQAGAR